MRTPRLLPTKIGSGYRAPRQAHVISTNRPRPSSVRPNHSPRSHAYPRSLTPNLQHPRIPTNDETQKTFTNLVLFWAAMMTSDQSNVELRLRRQAQSPVLCGQITLVWQCTSQTSAPQTQTFTQITHDRTLCTVFWSYLRTQRSTHVRRFVCVVRLSSKSTWVLISCTHHHEVHHD